MFLTEVIVIGIALCLAVLGTVVIYRETRDSPLLEMKILLLMYISLMITLFGYLAAALFQSPRTPVNSGIVSFHRITLSFMLVAESSIIFVFKAPTLKTSYKDLFLVLSSQGLFSFSVIWVVLHLDHRIDGDVLSTVFDPVGILLSGVSAIVISLYITNRVREIGKILSSRQKKFLTFPSLLVYDVLFILLAAFLGLPYFMFFRTLPQFTWTLFLASLMAYHAHVFKIKKHHWFVTRAELLQIVVFHKKTDSILFRWGATSMSCLETSSKADISEDNEGLIKILEMLTSSGGGILSDDSRPLMNLSYGDKALEIVHGQEIMVVFVVTETNSIVKSLTRYFLSKLQSDNELIEKLTVGHLRKGETWINLEKKKYLR